MTYTARKKVYSINELEEELEKIPETYNYKVTGSTAGLLHPRSLETFDESELREFFDYEPFTHINLAVSYGEEAKVRLRGQVGPLPTVSLSGKMDIDHFEHFSELLEGEDWK